MDPLIKETSDLITWYRRDARKAIAELAGDRVSDFDSRASRLEKFIGFLGHEVAACFLGKSGVGKSTLINAIVADHQVLLPAGGVGPLTAQAIQVGYSAQPHFKVNYHGPAAFNRLLFALETALERAKGVQPRRASAGNADQLETDGSNREQFERQARLMITGDQNRPAPLEYLVDGLHEVAGRAPRWNTQRNAEDWRRVERLKVVLALGKSKQPYEKAGTTTDPKFMQELRDHAAGYLAPLIKEIQLGWPSPVLHKGLRLVDLPGVGISGDVYRTVTEKWVREEARAICLVVDRSGIDAASADLLRTSGFLNRLLHSSDDPEADPVSLLIAVVRMDDVAYAEFQQEKAVNPNGYRKKHQHLADLRNRMPQTVQVQLYDELKKLIEELEGPARTASEGALNRIQNTLQVHALTAREFVNLLDDESAFITEPGESGVPQFRDALIGLVEGRHGILRHRVMEATADLRHSLTTLLNTLEAQWQGDATESREAERIRGALQQFLPNLNRELYARQGKFHEFLKEGVPAKLDSLVESASSAAEKDMTRYLWKLEDAHWATLRATVSRGGAFIGKRHIDLPRDFSLLYDGQVAPIWGENVIKLVRERTSRLGADYVDLVEEVVAWAEKQGAKNQAKALATLRDQIRADAKALATVGKEGADELRQRVKDRLLKAISGPIQKRCMKFVEEGRHIGPGVKRRILDFFGDLVPLVIGAAKPPTSRVLKDSFSTVELEIREHFDKYPDPLRSAEQAIIKNHNESEARSMAQRRGRVLEDLKKLKSSCPEPLSAKTRAVAS
jgi:hypothetical protein